MEENKKFAEIMEDIAIEKAILDNKNEEMLETTKNARVKLHNFLTILAEKIKREIKIERIYSLCIEDSHIMVRSIIKYNGDLYLKSEGWSEIKILNPLYHYNIDDLCTLYDFFAQSKNEILEQIEVNITELCPVCEEEVEIPNIFDVHICPNCGNPILPCGICKDKNCTECPLMVKELATFQKLAVERYYNK